MTPKKYRYKHTVEAVQWDGAAETAEYLRKRSKNRLYAHKNQDGWFLYLQGDDDELPLLITLGVYVLIYWDDHIELLNHIYFERDYEPVDDLKVSNSTGLESGWQPIESAPPGYNAEKGFTHILFKGRSVSRSFSGYVYVSGWMSHDRKPQHNYSYKLEILGWKHLPE